METKKGEKREVRRKGRAEGGRDVSKDQWSPLSSKTDRFFQTPEESSRNR